MSSKTYFSKTNPTVEYVKTEDDLKKIVLELTLLVDKLKKLINNKEKE